MPLDEVAGVNESETNFCATSTLTVAETVPLAAVITAEPLPTEVMVAVFHCRPRWPRWHCWCST
jgi:hypothetical protein